MKEDLVFKAAKAIAGGREHRTGQGGTLESGSNPSGVNNFQARYAIRHPWEGKIECANPIRGRWGGPPAGGSVKKAQAALDLAFAPRGAKLASFVKQDIPELDVTGGGDAKSADKTAAGAGSGEDKPATETPKKDEAEKKSKGCGCQSTSGGGLASGLLVLLGIALLRRRKR